MTSFEINKDVMWTPERWKKKWEKRKKKWEKIKNKREMRKEKGESEREMRKEDRENRKYKWAFNAFKASLSFIFPKMTQISREVGILGSELLIHFIGHWLNLTIVSVWCNGYNAWLLPQT